MNLTKQSRKKLARNSSKKFFASLLFLFLLCSLPHVAQADIDLTADYIKYNMESSTGVANGNVHLSRGKDNIKGGTLNADFKNGSYILDKNISGFLAEKELYFFGDHMHWTHKDDNDIINLTGNVRFEHKTKAQDYDNTKTTKIYTDAVIGTTATMETKLDKFVLTGPVKADIVSQRTKIFGDNLVWERAGEEKLNLDGNVRVERIAQKASSKEKQLVTDTLTGNNALYLTQKDYLKLEGNVAGKIISQDATSSCDTLTWQKEAGGTAVEMLGSARINRFDGLETLAANRAKYIQLGEGYELEDDVEMVTETRHINCDKFIKHGKYFKGFNITRFEDMKQQYNARGEKLVGTLTKNSKTKEDEIAESTFSGNVYFEFTNKQNQKNVITGDEARYTKANDTVTVTGNPLATRSDGKKIKADQFRVNLATKVYYAEGNAHLLYVKEDSKKNEDVKTDKDQDKQGEEKNSNEAEQVEKTL